MGWLPFHVAILTVVVGLLLVTCAFLIGISISEGDGARTALVRFTGIGWEALERIDVLAAGHIGGPSAAASR